MSHVGKAPIRRPSLYDEAADRIRDMIVEGTLAPGSKVPEKQLCESFGISRTPLREALKVLANEGLLELTPNRGATVTDLSLEEIQDAFQVMGALESLSGELAARNATEADVAELRGMTERMRQCYDEGRLPDYFRINQKIHERLLELAGNMVLAEQHRILNARILRARYLSNTRPAGWSHGIDDHLAMIDLLAEGEGRKLGRLLRRHLLKKLHVIEEELGARRPRTRSRRADDPNSHGNVQPRDEHLLESSR
jgi:DNA-binding GntR family transcriptional regulator